MTKTKIARTLAIALTAIAALSLASCACPFISKDCCSDGTCETCSQ